jgi:ABC-2 type transport system ATP-binding protein
MAEEKISRLIVKNVSKTFRLPHERHSSLKQAFLNLHKRNYENFHVLNDISFDVKDGEFFGIVGRNGSGKSTLLKLIAGIYTPTQGSIKVNGRLTPFIELGVGFNMELTGRENVFLNGAILGLTQKEINAKYDEIVAFAELERFMDQKLKNYSSGMQVRLAFSIAIQAKTGILMLDEVLAVGDSNFQKKCFDVFKNIKKEGRTVILVTHDMGAVQEYCDRAMMIQEGKIVVIGKPREVALRYQLANTADAVAAPTQEAKQERPKDPAVKIKSLTFNLKGKPAKNFTVSDDIEAEITIDVVRPQEVQINLFFLTGTGDYLGGINCNHDMPAYTPVKGEHKLRCTIKAGQLVHGRYNAGVGVYTPGYVPEIIDVIDRGYVQTLPGFTIIDRSLYQDGSFYIAGEWSELF